MLSVIESLPADVLGIEASGTVTRSDYRDVLIPEAKKKLETYPVIKMLFIAGPEFTGYEAGAMWDDLTFGLSHWREFSRIAVVTDVGWLATAARVFAPFFPGTLKVFGYQNFADAKIWLTEK